jgi:hypothetical protein
VGQHDQHRTEFYRVAPSASRAVVDELRLTCTGFFTQRERFPPGGSFHPHGALPETMIEEPQRLTMSDVFSLFGRHAEDTRWVASADSQEYLAVVLYLVQRNNGR